MLMKTDKLGIPRFTNDDLIDMIYDGHIEKCHTVLCEPNPEIQKFNKFANEQGNKTLKVYEPVDVDINKFDEICQEEWFMPDNYKALDIERFLIEKCKTDKEIERVEAELIEFESRNMYNLLRYMVYLVDFMRANNIVWGVGRGSSVASYVLYKIGIHKVNSIQYDLDYREFLR
jgi:DNA polymerase III alpha subunit